MGGFFSQIGSLYTVHHLWGEHVCRLNELFLEQRLEMLFVDLDGLHVVFFSIPAYKDLQSREDTRNAAWQRDGWDEIVYYTGKSYIIYWVLLSKRMILITHSHCNNLGCTLLTIIQSLYKHLLAEKTNGCIMYFSRKQNNFKYIVFNQNSEH